MAWRITPLLSSLVLVALAGLHAPAAVEEAQAKTIPWSGYWWPQRQGALLGPLTKHDRLSGKKAAEWEKQHHPPGPDIPAWYGYCHGWSASAVLEREPTHPRPVQAPTGQVALGVGDQKGLLTACHTQDVANIYGERYYGDGRDEDKQDLYPDYLWWLLKLYVQQQGLPLILDVEPGPEVWNFPVYAYRVEYTPRGDRGEHQAQLTLWMADDGVPPDHIGVKVRRHSYLFSFKMRNGSVVMGSGRWQGPSREDHPDFAWYPYVAVPENPEIGYAQVRQWLTDSPSPVPDKPLVPSRPPVPGKPPVLPEKPPVPGKPPIPDKPSVPDRPPAPTFTPNQPRPPAGGTPAEPVMALSPLELVALIADRTSSFGLDVTVDRFDGGHYQIGEAFQVRGASERPGYLYLLHVDPRGKVRLLHPHPGRDNRVPAQVAFLVPGPGKPFRFEATGPPGTHRIKAVVTQRPLLLTGLIAQQTGERGKQQELEFRWHPSQGRVVQQLLQQYQRRETLKPEQVGGIAIARLLGSFAQDEVAFYVGPRKDPGTGARK